MLLPLLRDTTLEVIHIKQMRDLMSPLRWWTTVVFPIATVKRDTTQKVTKRISLNNTSFEDERFCLDHGIKYNRMNPVFQSGISYSIHMPNA